MSSTRPGERNRLNDELAKIAKRNENIQGFIAHITAERAKGNVVDKEKVKEIREGAVKLYRRQATVRRELDALPRGGKKSRRRTRRATRK